MLRPKKNSYREFDNEKKLLLENSLSPPTHNFSNGPSLKVRNSKSYRILTYWHLIKTQLI